MSTVKLNSKQLNKVVTSLINEERSKLKTRQRRSSVSISESQLRRIVREELIMLKEAETATRPQGIEYKAGQENGPGLDIDDAKIDDIVSKLAEFDLTDNDIQALVGRLQAESRRRRGYRL